MSEEYAITCTECGAVRIKAARVDALMFCKECGHPFYSYKRGGLCIQTPAEWTEKPKLMKKVKSFTASIEKEQETKEAKVPKKAGTGKSRKQPYQRLCTTHCVAEGRSHYLATPANINGKLSFAYMKNGAIDSYITVEEALEAVCSPDVPKVTLDF